MAKSRTPAITTEHFALVWRRRPATRSPAATVTSPAPIHVATGLDRLPVKPVIAARAPGLTLAIGKKLMPRAVDRNRVKRIAREAWRARAVCDADFAHKLSVFIRLQRRVVVLDSLSDLRKKRVLRDELDRLLTRVPVNALSHPAAAAGVNVVKVSP